MKDLVLIPDDQPGILARVGEACGAAGVNIAGVSAMTGEGKGIVHVLVDDGDRALTTLTEAGLNVLASRDVLVLDLPDQPGAMGTVCRQLSDAGVNVQQAYIANGSRLVVLVDDLERAQQAVQ